MAPLGLDAWNLWTESEEAHVAVLFFLGGCTRNFPLPTNGTRGPQQRKRGVLPNGPPLLF